MNSTLKALTVIASGSAAAMTLAVAPNVNAMTITQTQSIPFTTTNWNTGDPPPSPLVFGQFDPSLGTLISIEVTATARAQGFYNVENDSTTATTDYGTEVLLGNDEVGANVLVTGPASVALNPNPVDSVGGGTLAVSDGVEGSGPDFFGFTIDPADAIDTAFLSLTDPADFAPYIGLDTILFNAASASDITVSLSGGNPVSTNQVDSDVEVTIVYNFEEADMPPGPESVPEPGMLLGLATVAGAGFMSRRRKS